MLVLLHFFKLGYSPFTLAFLFLLYEFAGIVANLGGGWLASRFGIPRMLAVGQVLQIAGLADAVGARSRLDRGRARSPGWSARRASPAWPRTSPRPRRSRRSRRRRAERRRANCSSGSPGSPARRTR